MEFPTFDVAGCALVRIPTRAEVRAAVARQQDALLVAEASGANVSQLALDQTDQVRLYAAALERTHGPDAATLFLETWAQEIEAHVTHAGLRSTRDAAMADAEAEATRSTADCVAAFVAVVVVGLLLATFLLRS